MLVFGAALWVLYRELEGFRYEDVVQYLATLSPVSLLLAFGLTALSYAAFIGHDALALRYVRHPLPYRRVALASLIGFGISNGTISVMDLKTNKVTDTWTTGGIPDMMQLSPDGQQLWVAGRYDGVVYVVDTSSWKVLHTIPIGIEPHGLTYFPNPGRFSLGHNGVYR